ncbi:hypothetical protein BC940DRAFT_306084 [Gongronella butleri]|nr:hypothetical protein BC940DRAFT_306084 [Gongronella butleri]
MNELLQIRETTQQLLNVKANLRQSSESLAQKTDILEELTAERHRLLKEKRLLLELLQGVQKDIDTIAEMEGDLERECNDLKATVDQLKNHDYQPLHDHVNDMRSAKGMHKIPHIQQDMDNQMAKRLQERREEWQHGSSSSSVASSSTPAPQATGSRTNTASTSTTSASSPSSRRGRPKKRRHDA